MKLRSGLRDRRASSLKIRLKAAEPDVAAGDMCGRVVTGSGRPGQQQPPQAQREAGRSSAAESSRSRRPAAGHCTEKPFAEGQAQAE